MKVFDSIVNYKWDGKHISFDKKNVIAHRNAIFSQNINLNKNKYVLKIVGKKRNGNGIINIKFIKDNGKILYKDIINFTRNAWSEYSFIFESEENCKVILELSRQRGVIGTVEIGRVILEKQTNETKAIVPNTAPPKYRPRSRRKVSALNNNATAKNKPKEIQKEKIIIRKKIAFIVPYGIYGGAEIYIKNLISELDQNIYDITILYMQKNNLQSHLSGNHIRHKDVRNTNHLSGTILSDKYDYIVYYNREDVYKVLISLQRNKKINSNLIEIYHSDFKWAGSLSRLRKRENIHTLFTISSNLAEDIHGVKEKVVLPVGIDLIKFSGAKNLATRSELGLPKSGKVIGTVARLSKEKNLDYIVDLAKEMPEFNFVIIGEGPYRLKLENKIRNLNIKNVYLPGFKHNIYRYYGLFDGFVLSSTIEGLPISIIEAMASEVPVFTTMVGAISDAVKDGITGFKIIQDTKIDSETIKRNIENTKVIENAKKYVTRFHDIKENILIFSKALLSSNNLFVKNNKDKSKYVIIRGEYI